MAYFRGNLLRNASSMKDCYSKTPMHGKTRFAALAFVRAFSASRAIPFHVHIYLGVHVCIPAYSNANPTKIKNYRTEPCLDSKPSVKKQVLRSQFLQGYLDVKQ